MKTWQTVLMALGMFCSCTIAEGQDQFPLSRAVFVNNPQDIGTYPITAHITRVEFRPGLGWKVEFDRRVGPNAWPSFVTPGWSGPLQYTLGLCRIPINTCSATIEYWQSRNDEQPPNGGFGAGGDPGQIGRDWFYDARWGELQGWQPAMGEKVVVFIVAGDARNQSELPGGAIKQRTDAVVVTWGVEWTSASAPVPIDPSHPPTPTEPQPPVVQPQPVPNDIVGLLTALALGQKDAAGQIERAFADLTNQNTELKAVINKRFDQHEQDPPYWLKRGLAALVKDPTFWSGISAVLGYFGIKQIAH